MATTQDPRTQGLSCVFDKSNLTAVEVRQRLSATAAERAAVADRLGLVELPMLEADLVLRRGSVAGSYVITGRATAVVVQTCVVTLVPVENRIEVAFEAVYADAGSPMADPAFGDDPPGSAENQDGPDIVVGDLIDLGEEVIQQVACAIDPYPRSPGAEVDPQWGSDGDEIPDSGPFAALAKVRRGP